MGNIQASAVHRRSIFSVGSFDLGKRRDGRSDVWCATWYDANNRTVRHRSLKTRDEAEARRRLAIFAEDHANLPSRVGVRHAVNQQVYFVGGEIGGIKIGLASNAENRLVTLQCGSPITLRILATVEGGRRLEREYHRRFAAHRLHGEWFERHPDILAEIDRLNECPAPLASSEALTTRTDEVRYG